MKTIGKLRSGPVNATLLALPPYQMGDTAGFFMDGDFVVQVETRAFNYRTFLSTQLEAWTKFYKLVLGRKTHFNRCNIPLPTDSSFFPICIPRGLTAQKLSERIKIGAIPGLRVAPDFSNSLSELGYEAEGNYVILSSPCGLGDTQNVQPNAIGGGMHVAEALAFTLFTLAQGYSYNYYHTIICPQSRYANGFVGGVRMGNDGGPLWSISSPFFDTPDTPRVLINPTVVR